MWVLEEQYRLEHKHKSEAYDMTLVQYERALNDYIRSRAGNPPSKPEKPICRRSIVGNITVERLVSILADNPRGVLSLHDELTSLADSLNQYKGGRGNDQQFYLSAWSGTPYPYDRVSRQEALCRGGPLSVCLETFRPQCCPD